MDHYQTLGLRRSATKKEIKEAFRRCALKFHPDRHSLSPPAVRDQAVLSFKQVSEAYEILIDDRRRAEYDFAGGRRPEGFGGRRAAHTSAHRGYGYGGAARNSRPAFDWEFLFRYLTSRRFLLNVALASALLGGAVVVERSGDAIWRMNNSGKSFEEAMESLEKAKVRREEG
ncbi:unnamed protein product [Spirodela intermedia]|uniref:J domain-containing protein n=2 Tax=Spirodela intermedia TaxID=51605 RepID=A0A7I8JYS5_SPIIN|nr:unnamed protein product [Spirodela intermedia]CAA6654469.1 unnamed protein product [Spirodela intermedia]CAA7389068.1 unnamed protein product [Spirodela intermedia]